MSVHTKLSPILCYQLNCIQSLFYFRRLSGNAVHKRDRQSNKQTNKQTKKQKKLQNFRISAAHIPSPHRIVAMVIGKVVTFLANGNSRSRSLLAIAIPSVVCLSVVCNVGAPYSAGWNFRKFFSPYDSSGSLVFWCQKSLVGDAPFSLKFALKLTHSLSNSAISTNIGS